MDLRGMGRPLSPDGLAAACQQIGVKAAELWAVVFTETDPPHCGFWADARPQILYEQHVFHRLTEGRFDAEHPDISSPNPGNYGASGSHQYDRLEAAMALDEGAALQATSWGIGQTLGENFAELGYGSAQELVADMLESEDKQLSAAVREMAASKAAARLAIHDWAGFARIYNGPNYAINNYDTTLASWYAKMAGGALPDLRIRAAQTYLMYLGFDPRGVDGQWGKFSRSALNAYQASVGLPVTDQLDDATLERLLADWNAKLPPKS